MVTPSARLKVAWVGHTRTQGGFEQWLQRTMKGFPFNFSLV
jgi:hypothetical protein